MRASIMQMQGIQCTKVSRFICKFQIRQRANKGYVFTFFTPYNKKRKKDRSRVGIVIVSVPARLHLSDANWRDLFENYANHVQFLESTYGARVCRGLLAAEAAAALPVWGCCRNRVEVYIFIALSGFLFSHPFRAVSTAHVRMSSTQDAAIYFCFFPYFPSLLNFSRSRKWERLGGPSGASGVEVRFLTLVFLSFVILWLPKHIEGLSMVLWVEERL